LRVLRGETCTHFSSDETAENKLVAIALQCFGMIQNYCRIFALHCKVAKVRNGLLRSESPSGMCAKLHTVAASTNRGHAPRSLFTYASHHVQSFTR